MWRIPCTLSAKAGSARKKELSITLNIHEIWSCVAQGFCWFTRASDNIEMTSFSYTYAIHTAVFIARLN